MNYEGPYFAKGSLCNLCPCFDIAFAQLEVIPRTRNKSVEIVAFAGCYLIINNVKNKESMKQPFQICFPLKLADRRMPMKKDKNSSSLIYNIFNLSKIAGNLFDEDILNMSL